uniref:Acb2/Tad1 hairpin domain-containing protein n=1 Tax=Rhizobium phage IG49 TaxID=3129228 RepID=A0AAU8HYT4_9CAUD
MREIYNHSVIVDEPIKIEVTDKPGAGGANHRYEITGFDTAENPSVEGPDGYRHSFSKQVILFQNGPVLEAGVNGITQETLLAIVADRLASFQSGPFACEENGLALSHVYKALFHLHSRTADRIKRKVEGQNKE